jgi:hypothetical protein
MVLALRLFIFLGPSVLDKSSQHSYLLSDIFDVIEMVALSQPQLKVVIIETFLRNAHYISSLLQIESLIGRS